MKTYVYISHWNDPHDWQVSGSNVVMVSHELLTPSQVPDGEEGDEHLELTLDLEIWEDGKFHICWTANKMTNTWERFGEEGELIHYE